MTDRSLNGGEVINAVGDILAAQQYPVQAVVEALAFLLADASAQITLRAYSQDICDATKALFDGAYLICCDLPVDQESSITTH